MRLQTTQTALTAFLNNETIRALPIALPGQIVSITLASAHTQQLGISQSRRKASTDMLWLCNESRFRSYMYSTPDYHLKPPIWPINLRHDQILGKTGAKILGMPGAYELLSFYHWLYAQE